MKKVRIDYYHYRLKKGRAEILLQPVEGVDLYCIPYHYVRSNELLTYGTSGYKTEDDGDLVLIHHSLNDNRLNTKGKEWISLNKIVELEIVRNESLHIYHNIFSLFLWSCPREGESGVMHRVMNLLETVKIDIAKKEYIESLRRVLEGKELVSDQVRGKHLDPDLIRKEMETLEHFRLHKPPRIPMTLRDAELERRDLYSYESIEWEALSE